MVEDVTGVVTWSSENDTIASVDEDGVVTGWKVGETTITAAYDGRTGSYPLKVVEAAAPDYHIELGENNPQEMLAGETVTLSAKAVCDDDESTLPEPLIKWSLVDARDDEYVTLKAAGSLTALSTLRHQRTISLRVSFVDEKLNPEDISTLPVLTITVYPRVSKIDLLVDSSDEKIKDGEACEQSPV